MVTALLFDCFGVLTSDAWRAFVDNLPDSIDTAQLHDLNHQRNAGLLDNHDFITQIAAITNDSPDKIDEQLHNKSAKNTRLLEYIRTDLKPHYAIGLISNISNNWIRESFLTSDEQALFDAIILSFEVGFTKPDPRIFMLACERLRAAPSEAVLIDDIASYAEAARLQGLQSITYRDFSSFTADLNQILSRA
jgi:FMN phosphatase YigB (HAD superfamily)